MRVVLDIETNGLINPTEVWVIVCKDLENGDYHVFRNVTSDEAERKRFLSFAGSVVLWIGHNMLEYDYPVLNSLVGLNISDISAVSIDTLIISRLVDYPRDGHSIEDYGVEFNLPKGEFNDWSKYSEEMEAYCKRDVEICHLIYRKYYRYISDPDHRASILLEHRFQQVVNALHNNGFGFNVSKADKLLEKVSNELAELDKEILDAFPPTLKLIRQIDPRLTQHGTLHRGDFRWVKDGDLSEFNGGPFCRCGWSAFNPASHKQIIDVLHTAGWRPIDRTATAIDNKRELAKLKRTRAKTEEEKIALDLALKEAYTKDNKNEIYGWKISESNLLTLPSSAPAPAKTLARRILVEARRRTLTEWLDLVWLEIEIEHAQLGMLGIAANGTPIQNGETSKEPRTNVGVQQTLKNQEPATDAGTLNTLMDFQSKRLLEWLKHNKINVQSAIKKPNSTLITIIGREQLEHFCAVAATATLAGTKPIPLRYKIISERIHGHFYGIGAWSHRMSHQKPNTANIPNAVDLNNKVKLYGAEMRSLWQAPKNRLLVGVDAEGIQLRIFAHYIDDLEFTKSLVEGKKDDKTDPHSLNQRILGNVCRSRAAAKRFIYALLLGAGNDKLSEILGCSDEETKQALDRLLERYAGFAELKRTVIPKDAKRGWFIGLDGRRVRIPDDNEGGRRHLAMSGYLQNGEKIIIADTAVRFKDWVDANKIDAKLVNIVHDEYVVETPNDHYIANLCKDKLCELIEQVGVDLKLKCPLKGDGSVGLNWYEIH